MSRRRVIILIFIVASVFGAYLFDRSKSVIDGPQSPSGHQIIIRCPDAGLTTGQLYKADVEIRSPSGDLIALWKDATGQQSPDGLRQMLDSMTWTSDQALGFTSYPNQRIRLSIPATEDDTTK